jgi:antitoxin component of MazEF toxin-antitoxin module
MKRDKSTRTIRKIGNSLGILLPKKMLDGWLELGATIKVTRLGRHIVLTPTPGEFSFSERRLQQGLEEVNSSQEAAE